MYYWKGKFGRMIYDIIGNLTGIKCVIKNSDELINSDFSDKTKFLIASHSHFISIYKVLNQYFKESDLLDRIIT